MNKIKVESKITEVAIITDYDGNGNPVFNAIHAGPDDNAAGSFLKITDNTEYGEGKSLAFDWEVWDKLVEVVAKYRKEWEWE
jgi:hypothetical protein